MPTSWAPRVEERRAGAVHMFAVVRDERQPPCNGGGRDKRVEAGERAVVCLNLAELHGNGVVNGNDAIVETFRDEVKHRFQSATLASVGKLDDALPQLRDCDYAQIKVEPVHRIMGTQLWHESVQSSQIHNSNSHFGGSRRRLVGAFFLPGDDREPTHVRKGKVSAD
jgi:hypothetical protein